MLHFACIVMLGRYCRSSRWPHYYAAVHSSGTSFFRCRQRCLTPQLWFDASDRRQLLIQHVSPQDKRNGDLVHFQEYCLLICSSNSSSWARFTETYHAVPQVVCSRSPLIRTLNELILAVWWCCSSPTSFCFLGYRRSSHQIRWTPSWDYWFW